MIETIVIVCLGLLMFIWAVKGFLDFTGKFKGESQHWRDIRARNIAAFEERQRKRWGENWKRR